MSRAEAQVIAAVCKNKDIGVLFTDGIDPFFTSYSDVWAGLRGYYQKYRAVPDAEVLAQKFKDFDAPETNGDTQYYVDTLRNEYVSGQMRSIMIKANEKLDSDSASRVLEKMQSEMMNLSRFSGKVQDLDITDAGLAEDHYVELHHRVEEMGGTAGIPTGIKAIDASYVTGMAPGHLIVVIGWPGRAKTWGTGLLAVNAWKAGFKPMIISLEMSPETMRDRLYTVMGEGQFRASELSQGQINIDDFRSWSKKSFADKQGFVIVSPEGRADVTPNLIQAKIDQHRPDLLICDYHQLFMDNNKTEAMTPRMLNLSRELKLLAVANKIPVVDITAATPDDTSSQDDPPTLNPSSTTQT